MKLIAMEVERTQGVTKYARCEITVKAASELAATWPNRNIAFTEGSIAWDISTGDFYGFMDGSWYKQDGSGAYSAEVSPSVQSVDNGRSLKSEVKEEPEEDLRREEPVIEEPEGEPKEEKEEEGESR